MNLDCRSHLVQDTHNQQRAQELRKNQRDLWLNRNTKISGGLISNMSKIRRVRSSYKYKESEQNSTIYFISIRHLTLRAVMWTNFSRDLFAYSIQCQYKFIFAMYFSISYQIYRYFVRPNFFSWIHIKKIIAEFNLHTYTTQKYT